MPERFASAMENLLDFSNILNASIAASWMVLAVIILRYLLKKAPRWTHVALWGLVAVRMLLPFSIESAFSLIPSKETIPHEILAYEGTQLKESAFLDVVSNPVFSGSVTAELGKTVDRVQISLVKMNLIWIVGIAVLLLYTAASYWRLRRRVSEATILRGNIYQSENIASPFVLGITKPKIYLPYGINEKDLGHVVAHEQARIRRKDHWWKPLGFFLLTIHWFNPLMWLAYVLLCRDIELACDEKVIKELGDEQRADYTQALVACSVNRRMIAACPLAFGEVGVKARVKSVMNYKKPTFWIIVLSVIACAAVSVCFLTNPVPSIDFGNIESVTVDNVRVSDEAADELTALINSYRRTYFMVGLDDPNSLSRAIQINCANGDFYLLHYQYYSGFSFDPRHAGEDDYRSILTFFKAGEGGQKAWKLEYDFDAALREWLSRYATPSNSSPAVTKWFDYLLEPEEMPWSGRLEINIPAFQDVTFRWYPEKIEAVTEGDITPLYHGMPIWNAYFCDLTGDGLPELCSTYSFGSGMIDNRVIIYDYANGASYELSERGVHDFTLRLSDEDGQLYVEKRSYSGGGLISSGPLVFKDGFIQIHGEATANTNITNIVDPTKDGNFAYDTAMEKFFEDESNEYFFSGIYSQFVIVHYADGTQEDIVTALNNGRATLADLDRFDIRYWAEQKPVDLSSAIISAILDHYNSTDPDGLYHCASFVLLEQVELCFDSNPPVPNQVIVYGMALHEKFSFAEETIREVESRYIPVKLTFERTENEGVTLLDAWFPDLRYNSWDEYSEAVYEQFVIHSDDLATSVLYAIQDNLYLVQLKQECYKQAVAYIGIDTTPILEDLLSVIESSPLYFSSPGSYIDAHPDEYQELLYYGDITLQYIFSRFLEGDQIGLRGHIMRALLDDLAPEAQLRLYAMTGQEYFDEWKAAAIRVSEQHDMEWIKENQRTIWILLHMIVDDDAVEMPTGDTLTDVATPKLTMRTLRSLVDRYGEDLTWDTFDTYYSEEIISDLYAIRYPVDTDYYLLIIGNPEESPVGVRLVSAHAPDRFIDIRTDSIDAFINATN